MNDKEKEIFNKNVDTLLGIARQQFFKVGQDVKAIDNKAGILITALVTIAMLSRYEFFVSKEVFVLEILLGISYIFSFIFAFLVVIPRNYIIEPSISDYRNDHIKKENFNDYLLTSFETGKKKNLAVQEKKANFFKWSLYCFLLSVALFVLINLQSSICKIGKLICMMKNC